MTKEYPSKEKIIFLVCDDARSEKDGKISLMGVLGNNFHLKAPSKEGEQLILSSLALYVAFNDGEGTFAMDAILIAPDGSQRPIIKEGANQVTKVSTGLMNLVFQVPVFNASFGKHVMQIKLDEHVYDCEFVISQLK